MRGQSRHDFDRRAGAGRQPQLSRKDRRHARRASHTSSNDPAGLEQIVLKDVQEHTGTTAVEKTDQGRSQAAIRPSRQGGHGARARACRLRAFRNAPVADEILAVDDRIRCWSAGSTGWAARRSLLPTPRAAGPPTGSRGRDSTACGPMCSAIFCRTAMRAKRWRGTTARRKSWWSITIFPRTR